MTSLMDLFVRRRAGVVAPPQLPSLLIPPPTRNAPQATAVRKAVRESAHDPILVPFSRR